MIGLFDSGIGGLTVVREVMKLLPGTGLIYFGDTARTPYGNKSPEVIAQYGLEATKFLIDKGATVIVVACNTVSAVGLEAIKQAYPKVPIFDVITPAIKQVVEKKYSKVGVMGTRALVKSEIYQHLLKQYKINVVANPAPLLVPLAEEGWLDKPETKRIVKGYIRPFIKEQVKALILACTHYPLLKNIIRARLSKRIELIDPAVATAQDLYSWLKNNPAAAAELVLGDSHFYVSDLTPQFQAIAEKWLSRKIILEKVKLG